MKSSNKIGNPFHDEKGRFANSDGKSNDFSQHFYDKMNKLGFSPKANVHHAKPSKMTYLNRSIEDYRPRNSSQRYAIEKYLNNLHALEQSLFQRSSGLLPDIKSKQEIAEKYNRLKEEFESKYGSLFSGTESRKEQAEKDTMSDYAKMRKYGSLFPMKNIK